MTGKHWRDQNSILGVGIYHAPRFLSDAEKERQAESQRAALSRKTVRIGTENKAKRLLYPVYPSVIPPKEPIIGLELPDDVNLGHIEVIAGAAFDVKAYNDGIEGVAGVDGVDGVDGIDGVDGVDGVKKKKKKMILSMEKRGVLDFDQQYNGVNFQYYVERASGEYKRMMCTNRLSFYIDHKHGSRIFPANIESQLSLILYRNAGRLKNSDGTTNHKLLAGAVRKIIPRLLKQIVFEVVGTQAALLESRFDKALRLYLLIHQVAIKLILYYPEVHRILRVSVLRWIQNPFAASNHVFLIFFFLYIYKSQNRGSNMNACIPR